MRMTDIEKSFNRSYFRIYFQRKFEAPRVLSGLDAVSGGTCIEIGCGLGAGALLINQYTDFDRIVCVDIDPEAIESARAFIAHPPEWAMGARTDNIELICEDAGALSFRDSSFDAAFLFGVLHHIEEWRKVIDEVSRVLKYGAVFSFEEALFPDSFFYFNKWTGHIPIEETGLRDVVTNAGFSIERFELTKRFELTSLLPACSVRALKDGFPSVMDR